MEGRIKMFASKNKKRIFIEGMMCEHCAAGVEKALKSIGGVKKVKVNLAGKNAVIAYESEIDDGIIKDKVEQTGKKVTGIEKLN